MSKKMRNSGESAALPLKLPAATIITQDKGGDGKSLVGHALSERARIAGIPTGIVEVDTQGKSLSILGSQVVSIATDVKLARRDPSAALRALTPLYDVLEMMAMAGGLGVVEFGANEAARGALWAGMVDLQEDLSALGVEVFVITPFTAQAESMRRGAKSASSFLEVLPNARLVLIENQRDGAVSDLHPASDAAEAYRTSIMPLAKNAITLRMPMIEAGSWRPFEARGARLVDAVTMPIDEIMRVTGLPRPEAKMIRGDVAAWCSEMFAEFDKLIAFEGGNNG
ncbi:hypothetical protein E0H22_24860 [Rhodopseudomonas boonkerdii]|jgi:hypothetical protein|uniref:hypothetical protein n=1 Tax=Hyphomicrobiales TaxID=356 RepID=UPI000BD2E0A7|nr:MULTISPECIES: hypothetical protein [Hyphomicrobiales]MCX7322357.1 hypothetical protein [Hyphomicrobiales bacterium]OYU91155.1 MAG: hypothetical protein CFE29_10235 [Bradyrhizobiaceae bacterium PARB1]KAB2760783.1 hypothetical protein F9K81_04925 [Brucella anthropi]UGV24878.1 hypothetical protein E0H22_03810 [Rhodopseudomonas boonkerdii]UGV28598.1 hypothetical protein E0H22_24860 [Rhodopseudomonas boonkerdii]